MMNTPYCRILPGSRVLRRSRRSRLTVDSLCAKAIACLTTCGVFLPVPCLAQGQATWSKAALLAAAEGRQDAIKSLSVVFSLDIVEGSIVGVASVQQHEIVFEGDKFLMRRSLLLDPEEGRLAARWVSWDGVVNCQYNTIQLPAKGKIRHMAGITGEPSSEVWNTQGLGFFDMNMLNAPRDPVEGGDGEGDQSLVSLLRAPNAEVRDQTEVINGRECHVVDLIDVEQSGRPMLTVWLDAERNVLPMRQHFFMGPDYTDLLMEFEVTVPYLTEAGIWLATEGNRRTATAPDAPPVAGSARKWQFQVAGDPQNDPQLSINEDYADRLFRVWEYVPAGTHVTDFRTGESWIAQADDVKNIADVYLASLPERRGPGPSLIASPASRQAEQSASIIQVFLDLRWIAVMVVSVFAAVGIARFFALRHARTEV